MSNWKPSEAGAATLCGAQYFGVNRPCVRERGHTGPHRAAPDEADPLTLRIISLIDQHGTTFTAVCEAAWSAIDRRTLPRALRPLQYILESVEPVAKQRPPVPAS
jgi:hypothetical protein